MDGLIIGLGFGFSIGYVVAAFITYKQVWSIVDNRKGEIDG